MTRPGLLGRHVSPLSVRSYSQSHGLRVLALDGEQQSIILTILRGQAGGRHLREAFQTLNGGYPPAAGEAVPLPRSVVVAGGFSRQAWQVARQASLTRVVELWLAMKQDKSGVGATVLHPLWRSARGPVPDSGTAVGHRSMSMLFPEEEKASPLEADLSVPVPLLTPEETASLLGPQEASGLEGELA
ncbi:MAG: hypothetical protein ACE5ID_10330 [Acidobacteriota bacterium]